MWYDKKARDPACAAWGRAHGRAARLPLCGAAVFTRGRGEEALFQAVMGFSRVPRPNDNFLIEGANQI